MPQTCACAATRDRRPAPRPRALTGTGDGQLAECLDPASALFSVPGASLLAEFPQPDQAGRVIEAVGAGERTHANFAVATAGGREGAMASGSLSPLLHRLTDEKYVLAVDHPLSLSTRPGKPAL
jgi:uncharacterized protein